MNPTSLAVDALQQLVEKSGSEELVEALQEGEVWTSLKSEADYAEGFTVLARWVDFEESGG